jgi:hypothetical protein
LGLTFIFTPTTILDLVFFLGPTSDKK